MAQPPTYGCFRILATPCASPRERENCCGKAHPKKWLGENEQVGWFNDFIHHALVKPIERQFLDLLLCKRTVCIDKNKFVGLCNLNFATN
jgi:hypothetical protein